jgi:hypothetical protein
MVKPQATLLFVYNADSSPSRALDFLHEAVSPATCPCNLCRLSYGTLKEKEEWTAFIRQLPLQGVFLHRDPFKRRYPEFSEAVMPSIYFVCQGERPRMLASAEELNKLQSIGGLTALVLRMAI